MKIFRSQTEDKMKFGLEEQRLELERQRTKSNSESEKPSQGPDLASMPDFGELAWRRQVGEK